MSKEIYKTTLIFIALIGFVAFLLLTTNVEALDPKLLWEKKLPFKIYDIKMAAESGDVILSSKDARQIILYNKNGNEVFHWGPRVDRQPQEVGISDNGNYFIYASSSTESFRNKMKKEDWDERLHYVQKNGKELWVKPFPPNNYTMATLSSDGKYIAFTGVPSEGGDIELWDSMGKRLWTKDASDAQDFKFSPDSKYLVANWGGVIDVFNLLGNTVFQGEGGMVITSTANEANYIATFEGGSEIGVRLFDKQGKIVLQGGPDDLTLVSGNGTKGILWDKDGVKIYNLPSKIRIKTYSIKPESRQTFFYPADISFDGRYLVMAGSKASSPSNIFVIDLGEDRVWETTISNPILLEIYLSNDGKFFLIAVKNVTSVIKSTLYYYQIY